MRARDTQRGVFVRLGCDWFARRLERRILIPLPDETGRMVMFKLYAGKDHSLTDPTDFRTLALNTEG